MEHAADVVALWIDDSSGYLNSDTRGAIGIAWVMGQAPDRLNAAPAAFWLSGLASTRLHVLPGRLRQLGLHLCECT